MTERTSYEPGTPSWADLASPDVDASTRFYGELFGWDAEAAGPDDLTGGYRLFRLRGRRVAGVGPIMQQGQPAAWSTYISTDDADAAAARAAQAGGTVLAEPMDVMDAGRIAVVAHPAAGAVGLWQPRGTIGAELVNEPGAMGWNELHTNDVEGAAAFYAALFGWTTQEVQFGDVTYTTFQLGEHSVGGVHAPAGEDAPAWRTYFEVDDCDAAIARAQELGGGVAWPALELEGVGRFAGLLDPNDTEFAVIKSVQPDE